MVERSRSVASWCTWPALKASRARWRSTPPLLFLAAFGLLFAVAARRLAIPDGVVAFQQRFVARFRRKAPRVAAAYSGAPDATSTMGALLDAKDRGTRSREAPRPASPL